MIHVPALDWAPPPHLALGSGVGGFPRRAAAPVRGLGIGAGGRLSVEGGIRWPSAIWTAAERLSGRWYRTQVDVLAGSPSTNLSRATCSTISSGLFLSGASHLLAWSRSCWPYVKGRSLSVNARARNRRRCSSGFRPSRSRMALSTASYSCSGLDA